MMMELAKSMLRLMIEQTDFGLAKWVKLLIVGQSYIVDFAFANVAERIKIVL